MSSGKEDGSIRVPGFQLPLSELLDTETHAILKEHAQEAKALAEVCRLEPTTFDSVEATIALRHRFDEHYFPPLIAKYRARYRVDIEPKDIGGVPTEVVTPAGGVPDRSRRVLINLHGGAFFIGGRWCGQVESIPIAAVGNLKVISVDYRMAPENRFPAASEDVVKVYETLLRDYSPANVGIYGCSAGAVLTAQTVALLQKKNLPAPGAVGMFGAAGAFWFEGDSGHLCAACSGAERLPHANPYFKETDREDPLAFPVRSNEVLSKFPPSLLIAATRDVALSSVVHMHSRLVCLGREADLHVWEGLDHAFHYHPDLAQSSEVYAVVVRFFGKHLSA